jgi:hypothetical protein
LRKLLGIIGVDLHATGQLLIIYSAFVKHVRKKGKTIKHCISYFIDFKRAYDSVRREVFYNILIEFDIPMKLIRLIKMCLNETYSRVWVGKLLSDMFPVRNGFKKGDVLSPFLFNFAVEYAIKRVQVN